MTPLNKAATYAHLVVVQSLNGSPTPLSTFIASLAVKAGIPKSSQRFWTGAMVTLDRTPNGTGVSYTAQWVNSRLFDSTVKVTAAPKTISAGDR